MDARLRRSLSPLLLILLLVPGSQAALLLEAVPDHAPWATADVPRLAVKPGNCMTWVVSVTESSQPVGGAAVSVTDADGRRSIHYTNSQGQVVVGTRTCWTTDHVADHAFQVTALVSGQAATSNRVVHEVMWSNGQVYAEVPESGSGTTPVPVTVVWTATNEPMPVREVRATYGNANPSTLLENGTGVLQVDLDGQSELTVAVPAAAWLSGGPDVSIPVRPAGPFFIPAPATGGGSPPSPPSSSSSSSTSASTSASGSPGSEETPPGAGPPPAAQEPERQSLPEEATPQDNEAAASPGPGDGNSDEGAGPSRRGASKGLPTPSGPLVGAFVLLAVLWRRWR